MRFDFEAAAPELPPDPGGKFDFVGAAPPNFDFEAAGALPGEEEAFQPGRPVQRLANEAPPPDLIAGYTRGEPLVPMPPETGLKRVLPGAISLAAGLPQIPIVAARGALEHVFGTPAGVPGAPATEHLSRAVEMAAGIPTMLAKGAGELSSGLGLARLVPMLEQGLRQIGWSWEDWVREFPEDPVGKAVEVLAPAMGVAAQARGALMPQTPGVIPKTVRAEAPPPAPPEPSIPATAPRPAPRTDWRPTIEEMDRSMRSAPGYEAAMAEAPPELSDLLSGPAGETATERRARLRGTSARRKIDQAREAAASVMARAREIDPTLDPEQVIADHPELRAEMERARQLRAEGVSERQAHRLSQTQQRLKAEGHPEELVQQLDQSEADRLERTGDVEEAQRSLEARRRQDQMRAETEAETANAPSPFPPPAEEGGGQATGRPAVGDYVQWTSQGADQFREPRRVASVSPDGRYLFVEGSDTGIPIEQTTISRVAPTVEAPAPAPEAAARPTAPATFAGEQKGAKGKPGTNFWTLTEDLPVPNAKEIGAIKGRRMSEAKLRELGFEPPERPAAPAAEPPARQARAPEQPPVAQGERGRLKLKPPSWETVETGTIAQKGKRPAGPGPVAAGRVPTQAELPGMEGAAATIERANAGEAARLAEEAAAEKTGQGALFNEEATARAKAASQERERSAKAEAETKAAQTEITTADIELYRSEGMWVSEAQGDYGRKVERLFGTRAIPTSFSESVPPEEVLAKIRKLNPDLQVELRRYGAAQTEIEPGGGLRGMPRSPAAERAGQAPRRIPPAEPQEVIRRQDIVRKMERAAYGKIRVGLKGQEKHFAGFFDPLRRTIRIGTHDLRTLAHELGHATEALLFPETGGHAEGFDVKGPGSRGMRKELYDLGKALYKNEKPAGGYKREGYAEFVRLWIEDRDEARSKAPTFSSEFERRLKLDDSGMEAATILDSLREDVSRWKSQPAVARVIGSMDFGTRKVRVTAHRLYAAIWNRDHFLSWAQRILNGGRPEAAAAGVPDQMMALYRGWAGTADLIINHGIPDLSMNRFLGFARRHGIDVAGKSGDAVRNGIDPAYPVLRRGMPVDQAVIARGLEPFEKAGYLEVKPGPGGQPHYYVTQQGRATLGREGFVKVYDGLSQILEPVADKAAETAASVSKGTRELAGTLSRRWYDPRETRTFKLFSAYAVSKRALEFHQNTLKRLMQAGDVAARKKAADAVRDRVGISLDDARAAVKELETPAFRTAMLRLQDWNDHLMLQAVAADLLSPKQAQRMKAAWKWYVPFDRVIEEGGSGFAGRAGAAQNIARTSSGYRRFKGSTYPIADPIESLVGKAYLVAQRIKQNQVMRAIVDYSDENPGSGWYSEPEIPKKEPLKIRTQDIERQLAKLGISLKERGVVDVGGFDVEFFKDPDALPAFLTFFRPSAEAPFPNAVPYLVRGKARWLRVDPELQRLVQGMDYDAAHLFVRIMGAPKRLMTAGVTLSPDFILRNPLRDSTFAAVNAPEGFLPGVDSAKGLAEHLKEGDLWFKWKAAGGSLANVVSMDRNYLRGSARQLWKSPGFIGRVGAVLHPIEALRNLSEMTENATRLGVFRRHVEALGLDQDSVMRAAAASRDASIDFGRGGFLMRPLEQTIPFLRAGLQAVDKFGRVHVEAARAIARGDVASAARFGGRVAAYSVVPSVVLHALWSSLGQERKKEYDDAPAWARHLFWYLPLPGTGRAFILPKSEYQILYGSATEALLGWMSENEPHLLDGFVKNAAASFWPMTVPAFMEATLENWANKSFFFDRPLAPEREQGLEPRLQYGQYTSETAKAAAYAIRKSPVVGDAISRVIALRPRGEISPRMVDNYIRGLTGTLGLYYAPPFTDAMVHAVFAGTKMGEEMGLSSKPVPKRVPVVSAFLRPPEKMRQDLIDRFYAESDASEKSWNTYRRLSSPQADRYLADPDQRRRVVSYLTLQEGMKAVRQLQDAMRSAVADGDKARQFELQKKTLEAIERTNERVKEAVDNPESLSAVRINRTLYEMRNEQGKQRGPLATSIEKLVEAGDTTKLHDFLREVPRGERQWAVRYAVEYRKELRRSLLERELAKAPKEMRLRLRSEAMAEEGAAP